MRISRTVMTSYFVAIVKIYEVTQIALTVNFPEKRVLGNKSLENVSDKRMFKNFICIGMGYIY